MIARSIPLHSDDTATHDFFGLEARHSFDETSDPMRLFSGYDDDVFFISISDFAIIGVG